MKMDGKTLGLLFELRDRLEARVAGIPAQQKALPRYMPDGTEVKSVRDLSTVLGCDEFVANLYATTVKRRVQVKSLVEHAQRELSLIGMAVDDLDPMNAEMTRHLLKIVEMFAEEGHSGMSAGYATDVLAKLLRFENLSPITSNPAEWTHIAEEIGGKNLWQSKRNPAFFSHDGGKTYHHVEDPDTVLVAKDHQTVEAMEDPNGLKQMIATEVKAIRRVRTAAGARQYGQPIGTIIRVDAPGSVPRAARRHKPTPVGYARVPDHPVDASGAITGTGEKPPHKRGYTKFGYTHPKPTTPAQKKKHWEGQGWQHLWNDYHSAVEELEQHGSKALHEDLKVMLAVLKTKTPKTKDRNGKAVSIGDVISFGKGKGYAEWMIVQVGSDGTIGMQNIGESRAYERKRPTRMTTGNNVAFVRTAISDLDTAQKRGEKRVVTRNGYTAYTLSTGDFGRRKTEVHVYDKSGNKVEGTYFQSEQSSKATDRMYETLDRVAGVPKPKAPAKPSVFEGYVPNDMKHYLGMSISSLQAEIKDMEESRDYLNKQADEKRALLREGLVLVHKHNGEDRNKWPAGTLHHVQEMEKAVEQANAALRENNRVWSGARHALRAVIENDGAPYPASMTKSKDVWPEPVTTRIGGSTVTMKPVEKPKGAQGFPMGQDYMWVVEAQDQKGTTVGQSSHIDQEKAQASFDAMVARLNEGKKPPIKVEVVGEESDEDIPEFDTDLLNDKDIARLRTVPESAPTKRVETTHGLFFDNRDLFEEMAQSDHKHADLFQEVVDQLDETETAVDGLYEVRDDPSSYDADEKADARQAVVDAFEALADALDDLKTALAVEPKPKPKKAKDVPDLSRGHLSVTGKEKQDGETVLVVSNDEYPDTPYYLWNDGTGWYSYWLDENGEENYTDGGYHASPADAFDALADWDSASQEAAMDFMLDLDQTPQQLTDDEVDELVRELGAKLKAEQRKPRGLNNPALSPKAQELRAALAVARKEQSARRRAIPKTAAQRGGSATLFPNPFHGDDTIDENEYDGWREGDPESEGTARTTGGKPGKAPSKRVSIGRVEKNKTGWSAFEPDGFETRWATEEDARAHLRKKRKETLQGRRTVGSKPGSRPSRRKTDVRPANPKDVPTGRAPAADDPLLLAANDAIYEATRLGVDQSILDQLNFLRERIRTGSTWVGGKETETTIRQARAQVRDGSTADVSLTALNDLVQRVSTPRSWSTVKVTSVNPTPPPATPVQRTSKRKRILTAKEKTEKAALDKTYRKTNRDLINTAKAHRAAKYKDDSLAEKLRQLGNDLDTVREQYGKKGWTPPVILRKKAKGTRKQVTLIPMSAVQEHEYDNLPNDEARRMYRVSRMNGADHGTAVMHATENAPKFASTLKMGRKGKTKIAVQPTAEGDVYTLRRDGGGWYATYDENGETFDVSPARYKTPEYALAALERWHTEYYARLNAGKTKPKLPSGSTLTLGRRQTQGGIDYYKVTTARGREYYLAYDGKGWYSVKYENDGTETPVHENYFADGEGALRFLEQADIESRRRKPGGRKAKPGERVISQQSLSKYEKTSYETVKKGDQIATLEDGTVITTQSTLVTAPVFFRTMKSKRGDYIYFTDGTRADLPYDLYRVKGQTKDFTSEALEQVGALLALLETKDVSTGSGGGHTGAGFGGSADLSGRRRPVRVTRRRKPRALDRARLVVRKKALADLAAFVDVVESKGVRRVRTREGMERFGLPMGAIIKPNHPALVDAMGLDAMPKSGSKLPKPKKVDGWTVYEIDVLGQQFGISNDGSGWYSYFLDTEKYAEPNYHENPDDALDRLLDWVATRPAKKTPMKKARIGSKEYPAGTKLKEGAVPPKANRDPKKRVMKPLDNKDTAAREALRVRLKEEWGVALPPGWTNLMVNADPDDDSLLVTGTSPTASDPNKRQPLYTPHHTERQKIANHQKAKKGLASRPKLEAAIKKDSATDDRAGMLALVLYMGLRPDTGGAAGLTGQTYGASTLERRHVVMRGRKMFLEFPPAKGKGKTISLEVTNPVVRKALDARMGLAPDEQLFGVDDKQANAYLKDKMGAQYTMKNLRTMVGTEAALAYIANRQPPFEMPTSRAAFKKVQKEVGEAVAEVLGNTPTVALNSYVDPGIWDEMEAGIQ